MKIRNYIVKLLHRIRKFYLASIKKYIRIPAIFQEYHHYQDNTTVILYSDNDLLWPTYILRQKTGITSNNLISTKVSLIASVKNEEDNIKIWFERICAQTYRPDEIIIADGGSTDGTLDLLKKHIKLCPIPIQILSNSGGNIAQGRNLAIKKSSNEIIAVTDFGCLPAFDWLEKIIIPFIVDPEIVVSAGIYDPIYPENYPLYKKNLWLWGNLEKISPENYLPPGGSAAFQKRVWQEVGGYPEWLTLTGEDTFFDLELKQLGGKWAFVPDAIVEWYAPKKFIPYLIKLFNWATGDGEMKIRGIFFWKYATRSIVVIIGLISIIIFPFIYPLFFDGQYILYFFYYLIIIYLGYIGLRLWSRRSYIPSHLFLYKILGSFSQFGGYLHGVRRQRSINIKRYAKTKGIVILLSGVPIDDTGGGARCTQIAMEFLRKDFIVIYLYHFPKFESKNLNLNIAHPNLIVKSTREINFKYIIQSFQELPQAKNTLAIIEHPIPDFLPIVRYINKMGGKTIYDKIDAWDTSLGGHWYSENTENKFINQCQILTATAPILVSLIKEKTGRKVHLLPNAVNPVIFNPDTDFMIPDDMPHGTWTGIYIGALWGDWFDWTLLKKIGETYPDAVFPIIGDFRGISQPFPNNIFFLGLKKQTELPAYLKFSNVAIIPWKVDEITQATSPIKVYEYISMRCPIVAPCLKPLDGIPGVYQAKDSEDFIKSLDRVRKIKLDNKTITPFIISNNWETRIEQILGLCQ